ncbi:MAG: hypothetical protein GY950_01925, partial [bacterium]|nr:hypothetical protein [bacterium]
LFGRKQKKSIPGKEINTEDEILGFLDDVFRYRTTLSIRTRHEDLKSFIYDINADKKLVKVQGDPALDEYVDKPLKCGFSLDSTWYVFTSTLVMHSGRPFLELPRQILRQERRKSQRVGFAPRERVKVAAMESLGSGIGVTGFAVDVSTGGICLAIERAMVLQNEREVQPNPQLLKKGTQLAMVRINRIPGLPSFDIQGVLNRIYMDGQWKMAIGFSGLPGKIKDLIKRLVDERTRQFRPVRRSRKRRLEMEAVRRKEEEEKEAAAAVTVEAPQQQENKIAFTQTASESEPEPALVPVEEPIISDSLISLGAMLDMELAFLEEHTEFQWIHVDNPLKIVRQLNEKHPRYLLLPWLFNDRSILDYLQKMSGLGVLEGVEVILFSQGDIPGKEIVKSRMLGVKHILKLPLETPGQLLELLET